MISFKILKYIVIVFLAYMPFICAFSYDNIENYRLDKLSSVSLNNVTITAFNKDGYGNIRLGEVYDNNKFNQYTEILDGCFHAKSLDYLDVFVTIEDNIVTEISTTNLAIASYDGVKLGDSVDIIRQKIKPDELEIIENEYTSHPMFIHWHDKQKMIGTRYATDDDIYINGIDLGFHDRMYLMEGCA